MSADCFLIPPSQTPLFVNETAVRRISPILDKMMQTHDFQSKRVLTLPLRATYSDVCLQKVMDFANTGQLNLDPANSQQMMDLAEELGMQELQERLQMQELQDLQKQQLQEHLQNQALPKPEPIPGNLLHMIPLPLNPFLAQLSAFHMQQNLWMLANQIQIASMSNQQPTVQEPEESLRRRAPREMRKSISLDTEEPFDNMGDVIIPSSDKEGWCRNKKYIEKTETGYMCTVCKKIYGRYNSVSYHVTIYHRNPPIRCDLPGCQFTTREARYIHFHKYYRHGIALPHTIDQGTRKCPYCRHVSKSPAMLEKHIKRHLQTKDENGSEVVVDITDDLEGSRSRATSLSTTMEAEEEDVKPRALTL